ncbi:MAG: hypothetical protein ACKVVT_10820 [Dehalococcoidia bacterium]
MGFYYGPNSPPPEEDKPGGFKEVVVIIWAVFRALALPLGILFGAVFGLILLFVLFTVHWAAGIGAIGLIVLAVVARGIWEWRHPPRIL